MRLNRKKLRKMILQEVKLLNEQKSVDVAIERNTAQYNAVKKAYDEAGIVGMFAEMYKQGYVAYDKLFDIINSSDKRAKYIKIFEEQGFDEALATLMKDQSPVEL